MAILEINLEKPALVEEYQFPAESSAGTSGRSETGASGSGKSGSGGSESGESKSSGGLKGKLLGLLVVAAGVGVLVWKLKSRGGSEQTDFEEFETEAESGTGDDSGTDESGGGKRKVASVLGLAVAVVGLAAAVQKRRN